MSEAHAAFLARITVDPEVRFGKPCIRGHRITVQELLELLSKATEQDVLADYPQLEAADLLAARLYADHHRPLTRDD